MKKFFILLLILVINTTLSLPALAEMVMYNTQTGKYHSLNCKWAKKCTVNCIKIDKKEAQRRGGIPCKVCGG